MLSPFVPNAGGVSTPFSVRELFPFYNGPFGALVFACVLLELRQFYSIPMPSYNQLVPRSGYANSSEFRCCSSSWESLRLCCRAPLGLYEVPVIIFWGALFEPLSKSVV